MDNQMNIVLLFMCVTLISFTQSQSLNNRPIIGVLTQKSGEAFIQKGDSYILSSYIKYLEAAGARVVPIRIYQPEQYYKELFKSINGVFFPGGGANLFTSGYAHAAKILFDLAIQANDNGDFFPVWGTCLGFELLSVLVANQNVMGTYNATNLPLSLNFIYPDYKTSKLFGNASRELIQILQTQRVTANYHVEGLSPQTYSETTALNSFYSILSTNVDRDGKRFVSSMEARNYPIFGVQFHPEKNTFIWAKRYAWLHTRNAIKVTQYFSNFFVDQARKNFHSFTDENLAASVVIENYTPIYLRKSYPFESAYIFNLTKNTVA